MTVRLIGNTSASSPRRAKPRLPAVSMVQQARPNRQPGPLPSMFSEKCGKASSLFRSQKCAPSTCSSIQPIPAQTCPDALRDDRKSLREDVHGGTPRWLPRLPLPYSIISGWVVSLEKVAEMGGSVAEMGARPPPGLLDPAPAPKICIHSAGGFRHQRNREGRNTRRSRLGRIPGPGRPSLARIRTQKTAGREAVFARVEAFLRPGFLPVPQACAGARSGNFAAGLKSGSSRPPRRRAAPL